MTFHVTLTIDGEHKRLQEIAQSFADRRRVALTRIGFFMLKKCRQNFNQLVKTGTANGVTWPKPSEATVRRRQALARRGLLANVDPEQIGLQSGQLAKSFRFAVDSKSVEVFNAAPYAGAFAKRRPIFPATLPASWKAGCESIVQRTMFKEYQ